MPLEMLATNTMLDKWAKKKKKTFIMIHITLQAISKFKIHFFTIDHLVFPRKKKGSNVYSCDVYKKQIPKVGRV
jgi:hypothetical protein